MPQKPLVKNKKIDKKGQAANRHGKTPTTKKGRFELAPKKPKDLAAYKESKEVTKAINAGNESAFAAQAQKSGGKLKSLKAPLPIDNPKAAAKKKSGAKAKEAAARG